MLQAAFAPDPAVPSSSVHPLRERPAPPQFISVSIGMADHDMDNDAFDDDDEGDDAGSLDGGKGGGGGGRRSKSRRELPSGAVATLKAWLLAPEHFTHPYPTPQDQAALMQKTGIDKKQLKNWFTNARRRIWKPMLKKQIEQGKITAAGGPAAGAAAGCGGAVPGGLLLAGPGVDNPHSIQAMRAHYQQAVQQNQQERQDRGAAAAGAPLQPNSDAYGNQLYVNGSSPEQASSSQYYVSAPADPSAPQQQQQHIMVAGSASIGSLPQFPSSFTLSKTDSHAVLMELFARDQDLVRQATESARLKAEVRGLGGQPPPQQLQQQQPSSPLQTGPGVSAPAPGSATAKNGSSAAAVPQSQAPSQLIKAPSSQGLLPTVPTLNSWPHFSSINSLNNLGTIPGVKSITSLSGADLASRGNVNRMGNLAQVKSMESMGKNDSYAFLEVFFGDRSSTNLSGMGGGGGGGLGVGGGGRILKGQGAGGGSGGDDDNDEIGLSLEDESPSHVSPGKKENPLSASSSSQLASPMTSPASEDTAVVSSGTLKRAFDDAMAARGLMSVSRSSERLTDLVLPAKIQRTLSQELMNKGTAPPPSSFLSYAYSYASAPAPEDAPSSSTASHQQYPGQPPVEPQQAVDYGGVGSSSDTDGHVKVSLATTCSICHQTNVDTQLRPCGHMFHERCLKPSLQTPVGQPRCPVDDVQMHCAVLAIPTDEILAPPQKQHPLQQDPQQQADQRSSWSSYPQSSVPAPSNGPS